MPAPTPVLDYYVNSQLILPSWKTVADKLLSDRDWFNMSFDDQYELQGKVTRMIKIQPRLSLEDYTAVANAIGLYFTTRE